MEVVEQQEKAQDKPKAAEASQAPTGHKAQESKEEKKVPSFASKEEKQKYIMEQLKKKQPNIDKRVKTEDVTSRKGYTFKDFNLSQELQLVRNL